MRNMDKTPSQVPTISQVRTLKSQSKPVMMKKMEYGNNICNYTHRICLQNKLEGCDHCIRHILYDKNGIFKQCSYVHPQSHKRCPNAARKTERKESVCPWHLKKYFIKRKQQNLNDEKSMSKTSTTQQLFRDLEHYCPNSEYDKQRLNSNWIKQVNDSIVASDYLRRKIVESKLHADNTDDEDLSDPQVENTFRTDAIDSDSESIDSDQEEPLKHAGIYTAEEVSTILRDKMIRLQSLYINELGYLQNLLKEKYKKYINTVRSQPDVFQFSPFKLTNGDLPSDDYNKLKALMRYHRYHGSEALLRKQLKEKRKQLEQNQQQPSTSFSIVQPFDSTIGGNKSKPSHTCIYEKDGEKCDRKAMPLTHYCKIHILYDVDQVLFRPCASGNPPCLNPVMSFQKGNTCILHEEQREIKDFHILEILSKDSVTVAVDAVVYFRINNAIASVSNVEDYARSTRLLAATTLRNVLGTKNLSEILSERESISHMIQTSLDEATESWGVKAERVEIKDVRLPVQLQRAMAAEAEATREARAKVIDAEGEQRASNALRQAAQVISVPMELFRSFMNSEDEHQDDNNDKHHALNHSHHHSHHHHHHSHSNHLHHDQTGEFEEFDKNMICAEIGAFDPSCHIEPAIQTALSNFNADEYLQADLESPVPNYHKE